MTLPAAQKRCSVAEYLRLESAAEAKHEFHAGEILAMSGGTYRHSRIIANLIGEIGSRLKGSSCFVLDGNMRVRLEADDRYVYPDASIVCGHPQFDPQDSRRTTIVNPSVVIEVLSESTEGYDRGAKFSGYRELRSLREYVLVWLEDVVLETFVRQEDSTWLFSAWRGLAAVARLNGPPIDLPLAEVYAGIFDGSSSGIG